VSAPSSRVSPQSAGLDAPADAVPALYTGRVGRLLALVLVCVFAAAVALDAQARRKPAPAPRVTPPRTQPAEMTCPNVLGTGLKSGRLFCDVLTERSPAEGIIITLPKRKGAATLTFDLHNRHIYSEQLEAAGRAYSRYTATIGVLTMENDLIERAVVRSEFRREDDLFDRVAVDDDRSLLKAVAPTGVEPVRIEIPENVVTVAILGEKLAVRRHDGEVLYSDENRPIAVISQPMIEFRPAAAAAPAPKRKPR
jgi:hypothetical protein